MILYPGWRSFFSSLFCYALFQSRKFCGTFFISAIDFCLQDSFVKNDVKILTISWNLYSLETISGPFPAPSLQAAYLQAAAVRHFPGRYANAYCQPILYNSRTNRCSRIWGRRFQGSIGGFYRSQNKYGAMSVFFARTPEKLNIVFLY